MTLSLCTRVCIRNVIDQTTLGTTRIKMKFVPKNSFHILVVFVIFLDFFRVFDLDWFFFFLTLNVFRFISWLVFVCSVVLHRIYFSKWTIVSKKQVYWIKFIEADKRYRDYLSVINFTCPWYSTKSTGLRVDRVDFRICDIFEGSRTAQKKKIQ